MPNVDLEQYRLEFPRNMKFQREFDEIVAPLPIGKLSRVTGTWKGVLCVYEGTAVKGKILSYNAHEDEWRIESFINRIPFPPPPRDFTLIDNYDPKFDLTDGVQAPDFQLISNKS